MDSAKMIKRTIRFVIPLYLLSVLLSGCATKRWSEPLTEEEGTEIASIINKIQVAEKSCPDNLEADARIFWKTPGSNAGITSYLQLHSPSFVKFIITNPLGMMMYALASDGKTFQSLDSIEHLHIRGNVRTLVIRMRMPLVLAEGDWFSYITGRLPSYPLAILEISKDKTDTTAWILLEQSKSGKTEDRRWIHIDTEKQKLLGYLFLDANGKTIAEISYTGQEGSGDICQPKEKIHITDLPWGSEIRIELQDISTATQFSPSDFTLPVPVGYFKQLQP
jgi:outer membrane lipoprotein-sorting protein